MNPENHLTVRFLRFLELNDLAEQFIEHLWGRKPKIILPPSINEAVVKILMYKTTAPFFAGSDESIFHMVAKECHLLEPAITVSSRENTSSTEEHIEEEKEEKEADVTPP
jgi:hypothetical protein